VSDLFVLKLDNQGVYEWHTYYGSSEDDSGEGIAFAGETQFYVTGWSYGNWLGDGGEEPLNPYSGGSDLIVLKLLGDMPLTNYYFPLILR
jgi:hypothetical protein